MKPSLFENRNKVCKTVWVDTLISITALSSKHRRIWWIIIEYFIRLMFKRQFQSLFFQLQRQWWLTIWKQMKTRKQFFHIKTNYCLKYTYCSVSVKSKRWCCFKNRWTCVTREKSAKLTHSFIHSYSFLAMKLFFLFPALFYRGLTNALFWFWL